MTVEEWNLLPLPWRGAFEQAWESFRAGSPPIGAVVADGDGRVISRGRSRKVANRVVDVDTLRGAISPTLR